VPTFRRLLVPLDGSSQAEQAVDWLPQLASVGTVVHLLRAVPPAKQAVVQDRGVMADADGRTTREQQAAAEDYLREVATGLAATEVSVGISASVGAVAEQILCVARERAADLIVMTTAGRTGIARWVRGSIADQVARAADQPVLLLPARARAVHRKNTVGEQEAPMRPRQPAAS
jgi:nucleotide-binding universal stress UspA family protein